MRNLARKFKFGTMFASLSFAVSACGGSDAGSDRSTDEEATTTTSIETDDAPATNAGSVEVIEAEIIPASDVNATDSAATDEAMASTGDAERGRRIFGRCMACHTVREGQNLSGPSLYGVIGRTAGTVDGFRYSNAMQESNVVWTEENLSAFLENPTAFMPGIRIMVLSTPSERDRRDIIAYLGSAVE